MDPITIAMLGGAGLNFFGSLFGNRQQNQQRQQMMQQGTNAAQYFQGQGITDPQQYLSAAYNPMLNFSEGVLGGGNMAQWLNDYLAQLRDDNSRFGESVQNRFMMPGDLQSYYQSPMGDVARSYDPVNNFLQGQMFGIPMNPAYNTASDRLTEFGNGQHQGQDALLQRGNNLMDMFGTTGDNLEALRRSGQGMAQGGYTPQTQGLYDAGNSLFSSGGMNPQIQALLAASGGAMQNNGMTPQFNQLFGAGQQAAANGGFSPQVQQLFSAGQGVGQGYTPNLQTMSQIGMGGLASFMPGGGGQSTQQQQLGPYGGAAMQQLLTPASRTIDSGYTQQNMGVGGLGFDGMLQLLARDPQIDQASAFGQQAFSGRLPQGSSYDAILSNLVGRMGGGGGISVGGGGGASGASAGGMLPVDPNMQRMIDEALKYVENNPLIPMEQRISMAVDQAGSAGAQAAQSAQRFARARGGGGAIVNSGSQNEAMADFADQLMRGKATAVREAMLDQQRLGLDQQGMMGQLGIGAQNADTNRQQVAASRDIASANNSTSASIANANSSTQAGIANAQMQAAMMQAAMQAALGARGQEYGQSQAGLQAMLAAQQIANDRGGIFNQAMLGGLNDATNRYGINAQLAGSLAGSDAQRQAAALQGSLGASGQANQYNLGMAEILAQLGLGAEGQATTRQGQGFGAMQGAGNIASQNLASGLGAMGNAGQLGNQRFTAGMTGLGQGAGLASQNVGMGLEAMQGAGGLANQNLGLWGNIGNAASQDRISRMGLGSNMVNSSITNQLQGLGLLGQNANSQNNALMGMGQLWNNTQNTQGNIWQQMFSNDMANRQLGLNTFQGNQQNALGIGGLGNSFANTALGPLGQIGGNMTNYMGNQQNNSRALYQSLMGQTPAPQNPWPQVNLSPGMFGGGGGGAQQYGGVPNNFSQFNPLQSLGGLQGIPGFGGGAIMTPPFVGTPPFRP